MSRYVAPKWRPPLMLVLGGSLLAILVLPIYAALLADILTPLTGRRNAVFIVAAGSFLATLVLGWLLWRLILAPVQALAAKAEAIRGGAAPDPLDQYGTPEIGELAQAVLDMAEVLQSREMAVRGYTDHVTHELKTPLTAIRGAAELLEAEEDLPPGTQRLVATIAGAEKRAVKLLGAARSIAAARMPEHRGSARLEDCVGRLRSRVGLLEIQVGDAGEPLPLALSGLEVVLGHIVENAEEAGATRVVLDSGRDDNGAWLTVSDNGPGISQGNIKQVFEPFFTTRRDSGGTGMGLAIVQTLLLAHGFRIALVEPDDGVGTKFRVNF
ncbi:MAG: HAMP domain-containing histidine kinase [Silicimonas sp.]|nr:HAMP domain-containing histidine kinase [Silicimonas sp.]